MAAFTAGNIVVYRIGGTTSASSAAFLDEYTPQGSLVQTVALPTTTVGSNDALTDSGQATYSGEITETTNGADILVGGYDTTTGTTGVSGTATTTVPRVVGIVPTNGMTYDTSTSTTSFSATRFTSAASADGQNIYVASGAGVGYVVADTQGTAAILTTAVANQVATVGGNLYYSTPGGTVNGSTQAAGIYQLGTGLPTSGTQTATLIAATTKPVAFAFATLGTGTAPDTLYVADNTSSLGIEKFSLSNGTWSLTGKIPIAGASGMTVSVTGGVATLYVTNTNGTSSLSSIVDSSGQGGTLSATPTVIATASSGNVFKGDVVVANVVCYASGTLIRTTRGDIPVEALRIGDLAVTASGAHRPIKWLGHRDTDCARHPEPRKVWPVRVRAGALGGGLPYADLWLSPGHAVCVDDVLFPARALIHGDLIAQVKLEQVVYWHVELDSHDILIANGAPSESYLDTGNRSAFDNAPGAVDLHPDFDAKLTESFCRPYAESGPLLTAARHRLFKTGRTTATPPVHLVVDGLMVAPARHGSTLTFVVPAGAREVRLASPSRRADGGDLRMLGVLINAVFIETDKGRHDIALDDLRLFAGFHAIEQTAAGTWRWTDGAAHFSSRLWADADGPFVMRLTGMFERQADEAPARIAA